MAQRGLGIYRGATDKKAGAAIKDPATSKASGSIEIHQKKRH